MTASSAAAVPTAPVTGRAGVLRGRWRAGRPPSAAGRYPRWSRWAWVTATAPTSAASQGSPRRSSHRSHSAQEAEQSGPDVRFPALRRARFVHGPDGLLIGGFGPDGAVRPWPARGVCGVLEVTGRTRKDAEKRLAAVHRAIRIREKRVGSFPALVRGRRRPCPAPLRPGGGRVPPRLVLPGVRPWKRPARTAPGLARCPRRRRHTPPGDRAGGPAFPCPVDGFARAARTHRARPLQRRGARFVDAAGAARTGGGGLQHDGRLRVLP